MAKKTVLRDQVWSIGKTIRDLVKKESNIEIGDEVIILDTVGGYGLITVRDIKTSTKFDVGLRNLGRKLR